jgi:4-hydroxy-tetrahydrodipicolinate synthase
VIVALLTPFGPSGGVDLRALHDHVQFLLEAGVDGLMPCGTTGEGPLLSADEVEQVAEATIAAAAGRARVLPHVGRPDTASTIALMQRVRAAGADGVSAVVPYYYSFIEAQILQHFLELLEAADALPVYAYTIPARTGNDLPVAVVRRLAEARLAGVKDSSKSLDRHLEYLDCPCDVLMGSDSMVRASFAAGSAGCVSALANVRPDLLCAIRDDRSEAAEEELLALRAALPMERLKEAVAQRQPAYPNAYRAPLGTRRPSPRERTPWPVS